MLRKTLILLLSGIATVTCTLNALAGGYETNDDKRIQQLEQTVEKQGEMLQNMYTHMMRLDSQKQKDITQTPTESDKYVTKKKGGWTERIKWFGDFRYRYQVEHKDGSVTRNRNRIRARIGMKAKVNDDTDFIFQMASSDADRDPVSANTTLDNYFSDKELTIDLAYIYFHPTELFGLQLTNNFIKSINIFGGKMKMPFYKAGKSEVLFDGDLRPEGGALKIKTHIPDTKIKGWVTVGGFWVDERNSASNHQDASLWGVQGGVSLPILEDDPNLGTVKITTGISYYDYGSLKGKSFGTFGAGGNSGSSSYLYDYDLIEVFGDIKLKVMELPVHLFADYVNNTARSNEDSAWQVGIKLGKAKKIGQWEAKYIYKRVERDSVLGVFTDSDFGGGGTGVKGHEIALGYMFQKNFKLGATLFINDFGIDNHTQNEPDGSLRLAQFDAKIKF